MGILISIALTFIILTAALYFHTIPAPTKGTKRIIVTVGLIIFILLVAAGLQIIPLAKS